MKIYISLSNNITIDPDLPKEFVPEIWAIVRPIMARYPGIPLHISATHLDLEDMAFASGKGMVINLKYFHREGIDKWCKDWDGCVVDNTLWGIIAHEIGHYLVKVAEKRTNFQKFHDKLELLVSDNAYNASPYGQENVGEACAEAFVAYLKGSANIYPNHAHYRDIATKQAIELWTYINGFLK